MSQPSQPQLKCAFCKAIFLVDDWVDFNKHQEMHKELENSRASVPAQLTSTFGSFANDASTPGTPPCSFQTDEESPVGRRHQIYVKDEPTSAMTPPCSYEHNDSQTSLNGHSASVKGEWSGIDDDDFDDQALLNVDLEHVGDINDNDGKRSSSGEDRHTNKRPKKEASLEEFCGVPITAKRNLFWARAYVVRNSQDLAQSLARMEEVCATESRRLGDGQVICSWAARYRNHEAQLVEEHEDGGEPKAGEHIAGALLSTNAEDIVVAVFRHYTDTLISTLRWRLTINAAMSVLVSSGHAKRLPPRCRCNEYPAYKITQNAKNFGKPYMECSLKGYQGTDLRPCDFFKFNPGAMDFLPAPRPPPQTYTPVLPDTPATTPVKQRPADGSLGHASATPLRSGQPLSSSSQPSTDLAAMVVPRRDPAPEVAAGVEDPANRQIEDMPLKRCLKCRNELQKYMSRKETNPYRRFYKCRHCETNQAKPDFEWFDPPADPQDLQRLGICPKCNCQTLQTRYGGAMCDHQLSCGYKRQSNTGGGWGRGGGRGYNRY